MASFIENYRRLERLAHLVKRKSTGTPAELAEKLGVAERTAMNLLSSLRSLSSVEIRYCRDRCSYYFDEEVEVSFEVILTGEKKNQITGGDNNFWKRIGDAEILRWNGAYLSC